MSAKSQSQTLGLTDAERSALRERLHGRISQCRDQRTRKAAQPAPQPLLPVRVDLETAIENAEQPQRPEKTRHQSLKEKRKRDRKTLMKIIDQLSGGHEELKNMLLKRVNTAEIIDTRELQNITMKYMNNQTKQTTRLSISGRRSDSQDAESVAYEEPRPQEFLCDEDGERLMPEVTV